MAVNESLSEGITLGGTLFSTGVNAMLTPPLVYLVGIGFFVIGLKIAWKFLRPHIR